MKLAGKREADQRPKTEEQRPSNPPTADARTQTHIAGCHRIWYMLDKIGMLNKSSLVDKGEPARRVMPQSGRALSPKAPSQAGSLSPNGRFSPDPGALGERALPEGSRRWKTR